MWGRWWEGQAGGTYHFPGAPASGEPAGEEGLGPQPLQALAGNPGRYEWGTGQAGGLHSNEGVQQCVPVAQILSTRETLSELTACGPLSSSLAEFLPLGAELCVVTCWWVVGTVLHSVSGAIVAWASLVTGVWTFTC